MGHIYGTMMDNEGFHKWDTPIAGWFMENPITKMDDDWGYPHDMSESTV